MPNYLGSPPQQWVIPVTRGCDRAFTVRRRDSNGNLTNWSAQVIIAIDIDRDSPTTVQATVTGSSAAFVIDADVCDQVRNNTRWRIIMVVGTLETPLAVGTFERHDG